MTTISFRLSVFGANSMKLTQMGLVAHPVPGDKEPTLILPGIGMWLKPCHNKPPVPVYYLLRHCGMATGPKTSIMMFMCEPWVNT